MAKAQHVKGDSVLRQVKSALGAYAQRHRQAQIKVKRQNPVAVRIRVVDPDFHGLDRLEREQQVWHVLDALPNDARSQITFVLLLTPEEQTESLLDQEFEHPTPSRL